MLMLLAGKFQIPDLDDVPLVVSLRFRRWLDELEALPPTAPKDTFGPEAEDDDAEPSGDAGRLAEELVGKGASFDPKSTIRIGFAWDDEHDRVVVGFVGRHQRTK